MQEKTVLVSGKDVRFRSSAAIPRLYRIKFKRDIFKDLSKLEASYKGKTDDGEELQIEDLEIFENVAYIMAFHADPTIPGTIEEWLDEFEMFSIYQVLPEILELWGANLVTDIESKKNGIPAPTSNLKKTESQRPGNNHTAFPAPMPGDRAVHDGPRSPDHRHGLGHLD